MFKLTARTERHFERCPTLLALYLYTESMTIDSAISNFLKDASVGSVYTRRTYRSALNQFRCFALEQAIDPERCEVSVLSVDLLLNFATWLLNEQYAHKRTMQTYLSGIMSFVHFLFVRDLWQISTHDMSRLTDGIRRLRRNQRPPALVPHPPPPEEIRKLSEFARAVEVEDERGSLIKWRNISIMETLLSTGLRVGELVKVLRKDLDSQEHSLWIRGKGDVERQVYFSQQAWDSTQRYLMLRAPLDLTRTRSVGNLHLYCRHDRGAGTRMQGLTTQTVQGVIRTLAQEARLEDKGITPHALRHYFGTRIYQTTRDLAVTQTAMGHSSPVTTRIYAKLNDRAVKEAHEKAFPSGK